MGLCWFIVIGSKLPAVKRVVLFLLFILTSCQDFSILEKDQRDVFFFRNNIRIKVDFNGELSVATFNIKFGFCQKCDPFSGEIGAGYEKIDSIADLINSLDLDIVALQEVGLNYDNTIVQNQVEYIANRTNMNFAYGMSRALQNGDNPFINGLSGNAILSKYEIVDLENLRIRYIDYYNQNHVLKATVNINRETEIIVLNSHFEAGSTREEKNLQINSIRILANQVNRPLIFAGDLNLSYTSDIDFVSQFNKEFHNSLELIDENKKNEIINFGTFYNGQVLDYIFVDKQNFSIHSGMLAPKESWEISDHYLYMVNMTKL